MANPPSPSSKHKHTNTGLEHFSHQTRQNHPTHASWGGYNDERKVDEPDPALPIFNRTCCTHTSSALHWNLPLHRLKNCDFTLRPHWELDHCNITDEQLLDLKVLVISTLILRHCPSLTTLPQVFLGALQLKKLEITACSKITPLALEALLKAKGAQNIEELRLNEQNLIDQQLKFLYPLEKLKILHIQKNSNLTAEAIANLIQNRSSIEELHVEGCFLTLPSISAYLTHKFPPLTLYTGPVGLPERHDLRQHDEQLSPLLIKPLLNQHSRKIIVTIRDLLSLSPNRQEFPKAQEITKSYKPDSVTTLDLSYADVTDDQLQILLDLFGHIETLCLYHNPRLTYAIAPFFKNLKKLEKLFLGGCDLLTPDTLGAIIENSPHLTEISLRCISLDNTPVAEQMKKLPYLKLLDIRFCLLPKDLASYIKTIPSLKTTVTCTNEPQEKSQPITESARILYTSLEILRKNLISLMLLEHHKPLQAKAFQETEFPSFQFRLQKAQLEWARILEKKPLSENQEIELQVFFRIYLKLEQKLKKELLFWNRYKPTFNLLEQSFFLYEEINQLEDFSLANLDLPCIPPFIFQTKFPKTKSLNLSGNTLGNFLHLFKTLNFPNLEQLFLQENDLARFPWELLNQLALTHLDISNNNIKKLDPPNALEYYSLKTINLASNSLKNISKEEWEFLRNFPQLRHLDLSGTLITADQIPLDFKEKVIL